MNRRPVSSYSDVEELLRGPSTEATTDQFGDAIDLGQAKQFLSLLDPEATAFTFQTFGEGACRGDAELTMILHGSLDARFDELEALNELGAGVFVTVNETDLKGRKLENIGRVRAIWHEDDNGYADGFPVPQSVIVQTSPGKYHHYWFVDDDMSFDAFGSIMEQMVREYGSDRGAKDRSRVLRLPGFLHNKGKPVRVQMIHATNERYSAKELRRAFLPAATPFLTSGITWTEQPSELWEDNKERVQAALSYTSADDRHAWFRYGGAIYDASGGSEDGFRLWDDWSKTTRAKNYNARDQRSYWDRHFPNHRKSRTTIASIFWDARINGWHDATRAPVSLARVTLPLAAPSKTGVLTAQTMMRMRQLYSNRGLGPSEMQWAGIQDAVSTMEAMADDQSVPAVYLSSLDPGVGKSQAVINFVPTLLGSRFHKDVSAIICVGRLKEIASYVRGMKLGESDYAVIVYDCLENVHLNRSGNQAKTEARVLFTTQQMLESRGKRAQSFSGITDFHYKGVPRQVRIWDEAMLPAKAIFVNVTLIEGMTNTIKPYPNLLRTINELLDRVRASKDQGFVDIPDFEQAVGIDQFQAHEIFEEDGARDEIIDAVDDLWSLSGKTVCIRRDYGGNTILDYENTLLDDLKPILVLDASGRVRQTYKYWREGRGGLLQLRSATKSYTNLTPHVWRRAGSKQAWKDNHDELAHAIAKEIVREPEKRCLVIYPKRTRNFRHDVPKYINAHLPRKLITDGGVEYLHWGDHAASNDYRDRDKVILATIMFREPSYYEATARASMGLEAGQPLEKKSYDEIMHGERADVILQAVCRGAVRKPLGDGCHPCDLYIIAARRQGIEDMLPIIFPGCKAIVDWSPVDRELPRRVSEACQYIIEWVGKNPNEKLKFSDVYGHLGMDRSNFFKDVYNHPDFENALAKDRIFVEQKKGKHGNCFVKRVAAA